MSHPILQHVSSQSSSEKFLKPAAKEALYIIISCTILGLCYALLSDSFDTIVPFINGITIGLVCGGAVAWCEMFLFTSMGRRRNLISIISLKVIAYVFILTFTIFVVILISRSIQSGQDPITTFYGEPFQHLLFQEDFHIMVLYAIVMMTIIIFTKEMGRKMGQQVLVNFITGKYSRPY